MNEIIVLTRNELKDIIRQSVIMASEDLIRKIESLTIPEVMTKKEVAEYLRCDRAKIDRLVKVDLPFVRFGDHPGFIRKDIDEWLKRR